jgi:hypothetical protein
MGSGVAQTMLTKQVSLPVDSLDPPSWPPRPSRSSELEERPRHGPDPRFLCPTPMPRSHRRNDDSCERIATVSLAIEFLYPTGFLTRVSQFDSC